MQHTRRTRDRSGLRSVTVSCLDLALLLDWCELTALPSAHGSPISILDTPYYCQAYRSISAEFAREIHPGSIVRSREVSHV